jgi:hypothetical protein
MARRKTSGERGSSGAKPARVRGTRAAGVLDRLASEEANTVLLRLLDAHPELRAEVEQIATHHLASSSAEVRVMLFGVGKPFSKTFAVERDLATTLQEADTFIREQTGR